MSIIIPANSAVGGGYNVDNSCRFNEPSSDKLTRSNGTPTSQQKFTHSVWVKRSTVGNFDIMQGFYSNSSNYCAISFLTSDRLDFIDQGGTGARKITTAKFRDVSAWYHIVVAVDSTLGTANDRIKMYVNGVLQTVFDTNSAPSQNANLGVNLSTQAVGVGEGGGIGYLQGYLAESVYIDGQQLDPTSFGEFDEDSGIWKPISVSGLTFGTNGFYLDYEDSSALGADVSGNSNNFTVSNLTAIDQSTDTCTNNFATLNALNVPTSNAPTFSEGNLVSITSTATGSYKWGGSSTIGMTSGKFYCEAKATIDSTYSRNVIGITGDSSNLARTNGSILNTTASCGYYSSNGSVAYNGSGDISGFNTSYTTGDIIGMALDLDNGKLYFSKNGTFLNSGNPTSGSTGTGAVSILASSTTPDGAYFFAQTDDTGTSSPSKFEFNFGSPSFAISSGNADGNGYGNFEYAVPSGYFSLNTKNLAEYG